MAAQKMPTLTVPGAAAQRRTRDPISGFRSIRRRKLHPHIIPTPTLQIQEEPMNARVLKTMLVPVVLAAALVLVAASLT
jgi:hypothetical protein